MKELEEALLDGRAHLAVHSAKDLPGRASRPGSACVAVPAREDPRDVLVGAARRPRRAAGGRPRRPPAAPAAPPSCWPRGPTLVVVPIRGNVGTRLEKLARGDADALVLAAAGLRRLGLEPPGASPLAVDLSTPAPGQGLLAVEARPDGEAAAAAAAGARRPRGPRLPAGRARVARGRSAAGACGPSAPSASPPTTACA